MTFVFSFQGFVSKTLDSASAQFAASALMTSEQLMGFKMKDDVVLGIGVNGVLPASGEEKDPVIFICIHVCTHCDLAAECSVYMLSSSP